MSDYDERGRSSGDEKEKSPRGGRPDPCPSIFCLFKLAVTITLTVSLSVTLTKYLLFELNLQVSPSTQPPIIATTTGGTCCQFNLHVSNQAPSILTTKRDSCCDSRDEGRNGKRGADNKRVQRVNYKPVYPVYEYYPRPKRVRRRAPPSPCPSGIGSMAGEKGERRSSCSFVIEYRYASLEAALATGSNCSFRHFDCGSHCGVASDIQPSISYPSECGYKRAAE